MLRTLFCRGKGHRFSSPLFGALRKRASGRKRYVRSMQTSNKGAR
jgi:hypothetical protein